jgi:hypothetical protein
MRGSTAYAERLGDEAAARLARRFAELVGVAATEHGGRVVELRGDEAMAAFSSARAAVRAAVAAQQRCRGGGGGEPLPLGVGIGLDAGEAVAVDDGYRARALNVAARLCSVAASGEILATDTVCRLAGPIDEAGYSRARQVRAKGVSEALVVRVVEPNVPLPAGPSPPRRLHRRGRAGGRWIAVAAALAVAVIALAVVVLSGRGGHTVRLLPNSIAEIDPAVVRPVGDVRLSSAPGELAVGGRYVWAAEPRSDSVSRIDIRTRATRDVGVGIAPGTIAVGLGEVWAYDAGAGVIAEIDPAFAAAPNPIRLPACRPLRCVSGGLAMGDRGLWVGRSYNGAGSATNPGVVWKLGVDGRRAATIPRMPADRLAVTPHAVWAYGQNGFKVVEADIASGAHHSTSLAVAAVYNQPGMTFAFGHAWVVSPTGSYLAEIAPAEDGGGLPPTLPIPTDAYDVAHDGRWLWITTESGEILKVDPYRRRVVGRYRLGYEASGVAVADGKVWVSLGPRTTR